MTRLHLGADDTLAAVLRALLVSVVVKRLATTTPALHQLLFELWAAMSNESNDPDRMWEEILPQLRRFCVSRVGADDAEDVLAQVHIEFRRKVRLLAESGERIESPAAYATEIAKKRILDHFRKRSSRTKGEAAFAREVEILGPHARENSDIFRGEVLLRFRRVVKEALRVRPQCRAVVVLRMRGVPYAEISAALGEPLTRLTKRFERCCQFIAGIVTPDDREDFGEVAYE